MLQRKEKIVDHSRRRFIIGSALTTGVVASGLWGISVKQSPNYDHPAYESWFKISQGTQSDFDYMIMCGALAASPHNTQPWKFQPHNDHIRVYADKDRNLGKADRTLRQMQQGLGCALYNISLTGQYLGYDATARAASEEDFVKNGLVAVVELRQTDVGISDQEFSAIFKRTTNRSKYDMAVTVPSEVKDQIVSDWNDISVSLYTHESIEAKKIVRSVRIGVRNRVSDDEHFRDAIRWWRYTREELLRKRDGVSIHTTAAPFFVKEGMEHFVDKEIWYGDFGRHGEIDWIDGISKATPVWGVIHAVGDQLQHRVHAGMMLEKAYLKAAEHDLHINPIDYPIEDIEARSRLASTLNIGMERNLMCVFRLGRGNVLEKSVRRDLGAIKI